MLERIAKYFSKDAREERRIQKAKVKQRDELLRRLKEQLGALERASKYMGEISDALGSGGPPDREVIHLDFGLSKLVWAFRRDISWWDSPRKDGADFERFIKVEDERSTFLPVMLIAEFVTVAKALLQLFYADSFKIAVTYNGLSQQNYNGRFEMWKNDAGKAKALIDLLKAVLEREMSPDLQDICQTISSKAEIISEYQPSGEVPEFDYSIVRMTASAMACCVPKNGLARDRSLPVGRELGDSALTASPLFGRGVTIIPYTWLSVVFNTLKVESFRAFLQTNAMSDAVTGAAKRVAQAIETAIQEAKQRIAQADVVV